MSHLGLSMEEAMQGAAAAALAIRKFGETFVPHMEEMERTILSGWPFGDAPNEREAEQIEDTFHELGLHEPQLSEDRRWYLAGQIVARFRRPVKITRPPVIASR